MNKKVLSLVALGVLLSGCVLRTNKPLNESVTLTPLLVGTATTIPPTDTLVPTVTPTVLAAPDFSLIGLPEDDVANLAFDFVSHICDAQWSNRDQPLSCPGSDDHQDAGYVMGLSGEIQGLPSNLSVLLTVPPAVRNGTLFGKYPPFTVKPGDHFRAVLACRVHTFCDVEFGLEYYDAQGKAGLEHWPYLFVDPPIVVDYPLDGIAGKTVQFDLSIRANGSATDADAIWIAPHIYRPTP